MKAVNHLI